LRKQARNVLVVFSSLTALTGILHLAVVFWTRHEITQVESIVAVHALTLSQTGHLYYDLNHYPFTVSPYMPLFYSAAAGLDRLGLPPLLSGRLLAIGGLLGILLLSWKLLGRIVSDKYARWAGTLLVAGTANLWGWGTVGQVDILALMFSLAALDQYFRFRASEDTRALIWSAVWLGASLFTKQTMVAAGVTIGVSLATSSPRRAFWFALGVGGVLLAGVLALNSATDGRFFDNAVRANVNPFSVDKFRRHIEYLTLAGGSLIVIALAGARAAWRERSPLYIYLATSAGLFLLIAAKLGSDLNYQLEILLALGLCAGWALDRLKFFPRLFSGDRSAVTLLQMPLLLHLIVNFGISAKTMIGRVALEPVKRQEAETLRPLIEKAQGRVISVQIDPLLHTRGRMDVEPLIYTLLVKAGLSDPEPVRRDLENGKVSLVILYEDIFGPQRLSALIEDMPTLPPAHLAAIRKHYRLTRRVPGSLLDGDFLYEPIGAPSAETGAQ
jgi:hypothetical protein